MVGLSFRCSSLTVHVCHILPLQLAGDKEPATKLSDVMSIKAVSPLTTDHPALLGLPIELA